MEKPGQIATKRLLEALKQEIDYLIVLKEKPTGSLAIYNKILAKYIKDYSDK